MWQPWLVAAGVAIVGANVGSWMLFRQQPLDLFVIPSLAAALVGTWLARTLGSRRAWLSGLLWGFGADAVVLVALWLWAPKALIEIVRVG